MAWVLMLSRQRGTSLQVERIARKEEIPTCISREEWLEIEVRGQLPQYYHWLGRSGGCYGWAQRCPPLIWIDFQHPDCYLHLVKVFLRPKYASGTSSKADIPDTLVCDLPPVLVFQSTPFNFPPRDKVMWSPGYGRAASQGQKF